MALAGFHGHVNVHAGPNLDGMAGDGGGGTADFALDVAGGKAEGGELAVRRFLVTELRLQDGVGGVGREVAVHGAGRAFDKTGEAAAGAIIINRRAKKVRIGDEIGEVFFGALEDRKSTRLN